jgi:hypothetical protein
MGQIRLLVPLPEQLPERAVERGYLAGIEGIPWRSRNAWTRKSGREAGEFVIDRDVVDSGNLYIPWNVPGRGELTLSTASLMERPEPYHLPLEIARGTVNRLRNQAAEWMLMGLALNADYHTGSRQLSELFGQAATCGSDVQRAATLSMEAIQLALRCMDQLLAAFSDQATSARLSTSPSLPTFLAIRLGQRELSAAEMTEISTAFNSAVLDFNWREIETSAGKYSWDAFDRQLEACRNLGLRVLSGPLLLLDKHHMPEWLHIWENDFEEVQASVSQYVRAVIDRYRGKIHVWNTAARVNLDNELQLSEDQRLRLVVTVIDELQRLDPRTPYIVSFDQPWSEYMAGLDRDFSPLHFADSLVRGEVGLAGIGLEMNFGYSPLGTQPRDLLEINRQFDRWNMLGLPLLVFHSLPSSPQPDKCARIPTDPCFAREAELVTPERQGAAAEALLRLVLAKPFLHGYIWQDVSDGAPHEFSRGGVLDEQSKPKPIVPALTRLRKKYLA